jgi:hypothetical protein
MVLADADLDGADNVAWLQEKRSRRTAAIATLHMRRVSSSFMCYLVFGVMCVCVLQY